MAVRANAQANTPPQLNQPPDQSIPELTTLVVTNTATDQDIPAQTLTYALVNPPAGAAISTNGIITWTPNEAQGPGAYTITTVVTDSGTASDNGTNTLSATNSFIVTVSEVNSAPRLGVVPDQTIVETNTVSFSNSATDSDIPANTLTYTLLNPPSGASINAASGLISYTPPPGLAPATYTITTVVTDNGQPPLSDTNSFSVTIASFRTNVILNVKIAFTAYNQIISGFTNTISHTNDFILSVQQSKVATGDFIAAIGGDIGSGSNVFSSGAKLLFVFGDVGTANQKSGFFVRDRAKDTDVSQFLTFASPSESVVNLRTNANQGTLRNTEYQIRELRLTTSRGDFDVICFATVPGTTVVYKRRVVNPEVLPTGIMASVLGQGHIGGLRAVFKGTVTASGRSVEIKPVPGP